MRTSLLVLLMLCVANLAVTLDLRERVDTLEAPPETPTVWMPSPLDPELVDDPPLVFPLPLADRGRLPR